MNDSALRAAIQNLLDHGTAATDAKLTRLAGAKKAPPVESCPKCGKPAVNGECPECGPQVDGDDGSQEDLASLLEAGSKE